ncbi:uncharacterized protein EI90DRAFT_3120986 [Cantharellus anzutake]|uniref:uncharacterized protein n=1 Tax=Cantharellus anzutake TaxID=1750568 RepID=UPI0019081DE5|nr:uncharacterized protein EI90DRAFT_3120986 [Cantharellus anzutake]KAF8334590.1 hypothetical protein EI90DRAFT_3120986 [Cantharellus anzutake]
MTHYTDHTLQMEQKEREMGSATLVKGEFKKKLEKMVEEQEKIRAELKERVAAQGTLAHEEVEESELTDLVSEEASTSKVPVLKKKKLVLKDQEAKKSPNLRKRKRVKA